MLVKDYLKKYLKVNDQVTFIKARARKDANTPFYHAEYQTTPINSVHEWLGRTSGILDYIILNDKQCPIDWLSGALWRHSFNKGHLTSMLVVSEEDFALLYTSKEQRVSMINYIDNEILKNLGK